MSPTEREIWERCVREQKTKKIIDVFKLPTARELWDMFPREKNIKKRLENLEQSIIRLDVHGMMVQEQLQDRVRAENALMDATVDIDFKIAKINEKIESANDLSKVLDIVTNHNTKEIGEFKERFISGMEIVKNVLVDVECVTRLLKEGLALLEERIKILESKNEN